MKLQNVPANPVMDRASEIAQRQGGGRMEQKGLEDTFRGEGNACRGDCADAFAGVCVEKNRAHYTPEIRTLQSSCRLGEGCHTLNSPSCSPRMLKGKHFKPW